MMHNTLVDRYRQLSSQHLPPPEIEVCADSVMHPDVCRVSPDRGRHRSTLWRDGQRVDAISESPGRKPQRPWHPKSPCQRGSRSRWKGRDDLYEPGRRDIDSGNKHLRAV